MTAIAALGPLSRDVVDAGPPRPGGTVFYAAGAFARLRADAHVAASCAATDRDLLLAPLEVAGVPVTWFESSVTAAYALAYAGERREVVQTALADPWPPAQAVAAAGDARWLHVGGLVRTDFPPETLAALAGEGRALLLDGQGLARAPVLGRVRLEPAAGDVFAHATVLKLDEEEARVLAGAADPEALRELGVPEVLLTRGSRGAVIVTPRTVHEIPAHDLGGDVDPTGAGDTFAASYLVARSRGAAPVEAARAATDRVAEFLARA